MSVSNLDSLRHPPEVVVTFVKRLIEEYRSGVETERRAQTREAIALPIVVQPLNAHFQPTGDVFDAITKDFSTGGFGVIHSEQVASRYMRIEIVAQNGEEMSLLAQVEHCTPWGPNYHVGARFLVDWSLWRDNEPRSNSSKGAPAGERPSSGPPLDKGSEMRQ